MIEIRRFCLFCVIFCLLSIFSSAAGAETEEINKQYAFAENLFNQGDFYRAITEYKRFIFYFPEEKSLKEKASFRIAESYFRASRWQESIQEFKSFVDNYHGSSLRDEAIFLIGVAQKQMKAYDEASKVFGAIIEAEDSPYRDRAIYQLALIYIEQRRWGQAEATFRLMPKESQLFSSADQIADGLQKIDNVPQKNPGIAGGLAAIMPGTGHLYVGRTKDALVSFLLNGSFIWAAAELFRREDYAAGALVSLIELGWYTGNIYSAVNSAHKYNRNTQDIYIKNLLDRAHISFLHKNEHRANLLVISISF